MTGRLLERPIAAFLILTFGISYLLGFPALVAYTAWAPPQPRVLQTYLSRVLVVFGPGLAAIVLTLRLQGRHGAMRLMRRLVPQRSDAPWAVSILVAGAISSGLALGNAGVSVGELAQAIRSAGVLLLTHFLLQILIVSMGEELGWRGWLLPRLLERRTRLHATLLTAAAWALWHGPLLLSNPRTSALFLLAILGLSVLYTWIWAQTGERLFLVVLAHATVNTPLFFWEEFSGSRLDAGAALSAWHALEVTYALVACVLLVVSWRWWMQRPHVVGAGAAIER